MHFEGTLEVPVPKEKFYAFVTDPANVISILPDVEESRVMDSEHFFVKAKLGMSYIKGSVSMQFAVSKKQGSSVALVGRGQGIQSTVDLTMEIALEDIAGGTRGNWSADAKVGGLLASVGSRLLNSVAEKYVKQITETLRQKVVK